MPPPMLIAGSRRKCPGSDTACSVDSQNLALLWLQNIGGRFQPQLFDGLAQNFLRRGVNQEAIIEHHAQRVISDNEPDGVILVQHCKDERALDRFSHSLQAVKVEGFLLFKELNGNIAVRFHACQRKIFFHAQFLVIPENAIVCEGKAAAVNVTKERVVVLIELSITLGRHSRVTHDYVDVMWQVNFHLSSGQRALINTHAAIEVVRNTSRVCAAHLAFSGERVQDFVLRVSAQTLLKID